MWPKQWIVIGVVLTAVLVVGGVIALTAPPASQTLPMALPIPAGTNILITNITNVNGTLVNASIATFTVAPPGGRLVGAAFMNSGTLRPYPSPGIPFQPSCPGHWIPPGTRIFNDTLNPGTYGFWIVCWGPPPSMPTPANPIFINVTETIQVVYG